MEQFSRKVLWSTIESIFSSNNYTNVRLSNTISSNAQISGIMAIQNTSSKWTDFTCFFYYISEYLKDVMRNPGVVKSVMSLRSFVREIKESPHVLETFVELQSSKKVDTSIPALGSSFQSTSTFLLKCLECDETFRKIDEKWNLGTYISDVQFNEILFIQKIFHECEQSVQKMTGHLSSISQVIPAISQIQSVIFARNVQETTIVQFCRDMFMGRFEDIERDEKYQVATLLDPRFAFKNDVYPQGKWETISAKLTDNCNFDFIEEIETPIIKMELKSYNRMCRSERPTESDNPFTWWALRHNKMNRLARVARDFLSCPAVAIDAKYFFGNGGRFQHLCKNYEADKLENWLQVAGQDQRFRGRGTSDFETKDISGSSKLSFKPVVASTECAPAPKRHRPSTQTLNDEDQTVNEYLKANQNSVRVNTQHRGRNFLVDMPLPDPDILQEDGWNEAGTSQEYKPEFAFFEEPNFDMMAEVKPEIFNSVTDYMDGAEDVEPFDPFEAEDNSVVEGTSANDQGKRKQCKRTCALCQKLKEHYEAKNVTVDTEKLVLVLGAVLGSQMSMKQAEAVFSRTKKSYYCRIHFAETYSQILKHLEIDDDAQIMKCSLGELPEICQLISNGRVDTADDKMREFLTHFMVKKCKSQKFKARRSHRKREPGESMKVQEDDHQWEEDLSYQ